MELYERTSDEYLKLNSCGIQYFDQRNGASRREQGRVDYHILYVASGICYVTQDGATEKAPTGSIILYRPRERQEYSYKKEDASVSYYLHFTGSGCEELLSSLGITARITAIGKCAAFEKIFDKMSRERALGLPNSESLCTGLLIQLLSIAGRAAKMNGQGATHEVENEITKACHTIYEKLDSVSVASLAADCFLSIGRFSHLFRKTTGISPMSYIMNKRMEKAREFLAETDFSVTEIGRLVGFDDVNYFSRVFHKHNGLSPLAYRKEVRS